MVQVKRTLLILYISLTCRLRQLGDSSCGVEAGGTVMAPQLEKWDGGGESLDQTLPSPPGEFCFLLLPQKTYLPSLGRGVGAAAEKGTGWIRLTAFYIGHNIRQLEKFT